MSHLLVSMLCSATRSSHAVSGGRCEALTCGFNNLQHNAYFKDYRKSLYNATFLGNKILTDWWLLWRRSGWAWWVAEGRRWLPSCWDRATPGWGSARRPLSCGTTPARDPPARAREGLQNERQIVFNSANDRLTVNRRLAIFSENMNDPRNESLSSFRTIFNE